VPGLGDSPELWLLGSSDFSARLAGLMGLPFAFAHHFAGGPNTRTAFQVYRDAFTPSVVLREPHSMVAVSVLVSDEAERLMLPGNLGFLRRRPGARPSRPPPPAAAAAHPWTQAEREWAAERNSQQAIGDLAHAQERIAHLVTVTQADEVIVVPQGPDLDTKLATLGALAGAMIEA
jgi:alkanesulfonate monooxygenase SsuD/methylene tetrahydromethanopterin reductase-like flavin-dependent oxidoreductase (luciferase family)